MDDGVGPPVGMDAEAPGGCGTTVAPGVGSGPGVLEESPWHATASNAISSRMVAENRTVYLAPQVQRGLQPHHTRASKLAQLRRSVPLPRRL